MTTKSSWHFPDL